MKIIKNKKIEKKAMDQAEYDKITQGIQMDIVKLQGAAREVGPLEFSNGVAMGDFFREIANDMQTIYEFINKERNVEQQQVVNPSNVVTSPNVLNNQTVPAQPVNTTQQLVAQ